MTNPVGTDDLAARWRPLSDAEEAVAQTLLDDAWDIVTRSVPAIEDYLLDGTVTNATIVRVVCRMVLRVMRNPEGYRSESLDDWTGVRDSAVSAGDLYLSDDELGQLRPTTGVVSGGPYVVSLGG